MPAPIRVLVGAMYGALAGIEFWIASIEHHSGPTFFICGGIIAMLGVFFITNR